MANTHAVYCFVLVVALLPVSRSGAQDTPELELDSAKMEVEGGYRLPEDRIPLSQLVRGTFPRIGTLLARMDGELRGLFLQDELGIEEGGLHESALVRAILAEIEARPDEAEKARRAPVLATILAEEGDDAYVRKNREYLNEDVRRLGVVWGQFVADLGGPDSRPMGKIHEYLEKRRRDITIASNISFDDPDHTVWNMERVFQQGVHSSNGRQR